MPRDAAFKASLVPAALLLLLLLPAHLCRADAGAKTGAVPPNPAAAAVSAGPSDAPRVIPDYGGRDSAISATLDRSGAAPAMNPLALAGRAVVALLIVLLCVVGGMHLLKRSGLLQGDGASQPLSKMPIWSNLLAKAGIGLPARTAAATDAASEFLTLVGSQSLPHSPGAGLHLVSVGGRLLLLGATPQAVTMLAEVAEIDTLSVAEQPLSNRAAAQETARFADYLTRNGGDAAPSPSINGGESDLAATADRLQAFLSSRRKGASQTPDANE